MNKFLQKTNSFFIAFLVFTLSGILTPISSRALGNSAYSLVPIFLATLAGGAHYVAKNKNASRLRCPKCKYINITWRVKPLRVEVVNESSTYLKQVSEEVGYTETDTFGEIMHPRRDGQNESSYYSGSSTSSHYEYRMRPHKIITYREVFTCTKCQASIGRRRQTERQVEEN